MQLYLLYIHIYFFVLHILHMHHIFLYLYTFLTEAGVAVTAPDADALSREIASALDGKYAAMPERAYLYAKEHFDVTVAVNTLCHVFENAGLEKKQ